MKVKVSLDMNADVYEMADAWETDAGGKIVNVPAYAWKQYQEAAAAWNFWQSYINGKLYP